MLAEFKFGNLEGCSEAYERDGAFIVRDVLDLEFLEELNRHIDWLIERNPDLATETLGHWMVAQDPFWVRFVSDHRLLDVAESLVGPNIAFFAADYIAKKPRTGQALLWHQDANYWPLEPMEVVTIWFAVSESNRENGCVKVIPGSHRLGLLEHFAETRIVNVLSSEVDLSGIDESKAEYVELNPGDISVHHPHTIHGSEANISDRWRRGGSIQYLPTTTHVTKPWPCTFLFRGEAVRGVDNDYKPKPKYVAGEHMSFKGCEAWR
ncbi:MAG: phytanoyl-CoA dioxygenase family protein [Candidatus Poribacteria bacterium]|nr:phytanoyl-CoA dioxygenase family protein [Candidatus Poribacteria bacterium]MDE0503124.1 phytanoyl-CoA dioxygenase family protein [Candidatus Poribacteria bacterium]